MKNSIKEMYMSKKYVKLLVIFSIPLLILILVLPTVSFSQEAPEEEAELAEEILAEEGQEEAVEEEAMEEELEPVLEITQIEGIGDEESLYSIELRDVELTDFFRVIAHDNNLNILVDRSVTGRVTASLRNITINEALDRIAEMYNLTFEERGRVTVVKPNIVTKTFILKHIKAEDLFAVAQEAAAEEGEVIGLSTVYDLLSDEGRIFLGKQLNSVVVMDYPSNISEIEAFLKAIDQKTSVKVFKLKYISVKDLFPDLKDDERSERTKQRQERQDERDEIKEIRKSGVCGSE